MGYLLDILGSFIIDLTIENVAVYDGQYSSAFWRQIKLAAKNLRNR